jgi:acetoacetate decarboxylase
MLGYSRPFTPGGTASIVPALPWQFAGDLLLVHFTADPSALAALLPAPLGPIPGNDEAFVWSPHLRCQPEGIGADALSAARSHYNVCVVGIPCLLNGQRTMFSAFQWGDRDWLVVLSWFLGACSKFATIEQTGQHPMLSPGPFGTGLGGRLKRAVSRHGEKIVDIGFEQREAVPATAMEFYTRNLPLTCLRHFPDCHVPPRGRPLVHDLTQMVMTDMRIGDVVRGPASLVFHPADNEELLPIKPRSVLGGYWMPMAFRLHGVRVVHDYLT